MIEDKYHDIIDTHFNVETRHPSVRHADLRTLLTEVDSFGINTDGFPNVEPFHITIERWSPDVSYAEFLSEFRRLGSL